MKGNTKLELDKNQAYKLAAVTDLAGRDKVHTRNLYLRRINCVAVNLKYVESVFWGDEYSISMDFVQNEKGTWINRPLVTSRVQKMEENGKELKIFTLNSIYVLEKTVLKETVYQETANLIELYLSIEERNAHYFAKGFYYDGQKRPHELIYTPHIGMFSDSVLLDYVIDGYEETACRYFPLQWSGVEFYDTLYHEQKYDVPMLIHNVGETDLQITFENDSKTWVIPPGESREIIPYQ